MRCENLLTEVLHLGLHQELLGGLAAILGWITLDGICMLNCSEADACIFDDGEDTATG
jgi:hypothetical protein